MSGARRPAPAVTAPASAARPPAAPGRERAPALARRLAGQLGNGWMLRAAWTISRTGRAGLVGIALLLAAALFLLSTHRKVAADVEAQRADLAAAQRQASAASTAAGDEIADPIAALHALPARIEMPTLLRQLFDEATRARLAVDTAKYDADAATSSGVVRYRIAFPVTGPYPQIRAFIDATLASMPAVALSELALERKAIGDGDVVAQIRMTVYTRSSP
jgi:Tfp pilus assembly protein PilO